MRLNPLVIARALGGDVAGHNVLAPGPGHSRADRSLSIKIDAAAKDGFIVHSFAGGDYRPASISCPIAARPSRITHPLLKLHFGLLAAVGHATARSVTNYVHSNCRCIR
jgi:hypothetical protein